ncbi:hypothetical protein HC928_25880, partial [bacterium]|nr:hypothetical protein [bacterium]
MHGDFTLHLIDLVAGDVGGQRLKEFALLVAGTSAQRAMIMSVPGAIRAA